MVCFLPCFLNISHWLIKIFCNTVRMNNDEPDLRDVTGIICVRYSLKINPKRQNTIATCNVTLLESSTGRKRTFKGRRKWILRWSFWLRRWELEIKWTNISKKNLYVHCFLIRVLFIRLHYFLAEFKSSGEVIIRRKTFSDCTWNTQHRERIL